MSTQDAVATTWSPEPTQLWSQFDTFEQLLRAREPSEVVLPVFDTLVRLFDGMIRECAPRDAERLGASFRTELMPWLWLSEHAHRWVSKPRGYAGDYLTIARMYANEPRGGDPLCRMVDRCFLDVAASRAVRHRRALLAGEIDRTVAACAGAARITSLACGPARELFDAYRVQLDPARIAATLVDFDPEALAYCAAEQARLVPEARIERVEANLIHVATGRRALSLAPQDLIYSIGLIDYFDDELVIKLLDKIHALLRPGGRVIVGNFHPRNPTKALMDHVLDWKLIHRDEARMHALFTASAFRSRCTRIQYEDLGINLFAECIRRE